MASFDLEYSTLLERWKIEPMALHFDAFEGGWQAETDHACFIITGGDGQWSALATESSPHSRYGGRSWSIGAGTADGAMLACRRAAAAGSFEGWEPTGPDPDENAARCYDCSGPCRRGRDLCEGCEASEDAPIEPDAAAIDAVADDNGWRLAVIDADGGTLWTGSGEDYIAANPDDEDAVLALFVGDSFHSGGGSSPWYAVVRIPSHF